MTKQRTSKLQRAILEALEEKPWQSYNALALTVAQRMGRVITYEMRKADKVAHLKYMAQLRQNVLDAGDKLLADQLSMVAAYERNEPVRRDETPNDTFRADFSRSLRNLARKGKIRLRYDNYDTRPSKRRERVKWVSLVDSTPQP